MRAHLARIQEANPRLNAIVTLLPEETLLGAAERADAAVAAGDPLGPLHGLPVAHKDLTLTRGIRTTFGSPIFADFVPEEDALIVERLRAAGAITIGKTNTPEFGAGSQTFNAVFGPTRNPWDDTKTCGGSSGGAAVGAGVRDGPDRGRERLRRLASQSRQLLRGGGVPALARTGAGLAGRDPLVPGSGCRDRWRGALRMRH